MRVASVCFILAGLSAISAAGMALAVTYPAQRCFSTPTNMGCSCGCPIPNTLNDLCYACLTDLGQPSNIYYYCVSDSTTTCTAPTYYCSGKVYQCPNCTCMGNWSGCNPGQCNDTDKPDYCTQYYGCTSPKEPSAAR